MKPEMEIKDYVGAVPVLKEKNDTTIYLRFPASLKRRIKEKADAESLSLNDWLNREIRRDLDGIVKSNK